MTRNCLVLTQPRENSEFNDFTGRVYHFPDKYLSQFTETPLEFIYYEPTKSGGEGVYFGCGKILEPPIRDKKEANHYFVEIVDYKPFTKPVAFKTESGEIRESSSPHYNAQNSVRKIPGLLLDEICLDGEVRLNFRADAHLIKVLGEQLIASEKVGVLELIKNAYDAGASYCRVRIEGIPSMTSTESSELRFPELQGPVIVIEDDGGGMTRSDIENGWLRPASTLKTSIKEDIRRERERAAIEGKLGSFENLIAEIRKARGGRIPLGEKGVGRFASHRLGRRLLLKTKVSGLDYEFVLEVDWDNFEPDGNLQKDLEKVGVRLTRQAPSRDYGDRNSGTQLIISGGRSGFSWEADTLRDLSRSIAGLNSPNPTPNRVLSSPGFSAFLECPQMEFPVAESLVDVFTSTFSFDALVDENGIMDYSLKFQPPKTVPMPAEEFTENDFDLRKADIAHWKPVGSDSMRSPECGSFFIHIDVWYRKNPWIDDTGAEGKQFIKNLSSYGGLSIYRDGINIFPAEWGARTDWLDLSDRHIKQGFRMSYYNMIGNIEIDQANNIDLIDKTNREGLIENRAFKDLTNLVRAAISTVIETKFIGKRDEYHELTGDLIRDPKVLRDFARQGQALVGGIQDNYPIEEDPFHILVPFGSMSRRSEGLINLSNSLKNLQKSIDVIQDAQELLTEQAGYGMAVAVSVHEIAKIASNFYSGVSHMLKSKKPDIEKLTNLKDASASLQSELRRLSPLRALKTEVQTEFEIARPVAYVLDIFRSRFEKDGILMEANLKNGFRVYGRFGIIIQVLSNLLDNSSYWVGMNDRGDRRIKISVDAKQRTLVVADSGPGIDEVILPYLFSPGYSLRIPPSGLGLYICKHYMQAMKGNIYQTLGRERLGDFSGAQFTLDFEKVPSERSVEQRK